MINLLCIQVPLEVFDYIDSGRNPQLYTKDCMEKAHSKNEEVSQALSEDSAPPALPPSLGHGQPFDNWVSHYQANGN